MKKNIVFTETANSPFLVTVDSKLKERKLTETNSIAIKKKMDTARAFINEHGLANIEKLRKESAK